MWTALLGTEVVNLEAMSAADKWALRSDLFARENLICRGCKTPVHTRLLRDDGDPFMVFSHNPHNAEICRSLGFHTDESSEHHVLKARLAKGVRTAGWIADLEVYGDHCRTDVLAVSPKGNHWALEAQLSPLAMTEALERTKRYAAEFSAVTWTHARRREWSNRIPSLRVDDETNSRVIDGVMTDPTGLTRADEADLTEVIPRILTNDITYLTDEAFGFYVDLKAQGTRPGQRTPRRGTVNGRGDYVRECARTPAEWIANGAFAGPTDRSGVVACATCRRATARWIASRGNERWLTCDRCRDQAKRYSSTAVFEALREVPR